MKVKIFDENHEKDLEEKINEFLRLVPFNGNKEISIIADKKLSLST